MKEFQKVQQRLYKKQDVCAVIISYNCDKVIGENIRQLLEQVDYILVIDNASNNASKVYLMQWADNAKVQLIFHNENQGIACRLNEALKFASEKGYKLILTMDQDTVLEKNCVNEMISVLNRDPEVVSVGPSRKRRVDKKKAFKCRYLITSGNLVVVSAAIKIGGYLTSLFIDSVDIEFSLALQKAGFRLASANNAKMRHNVGERQTNRTLCFNYMLQSHNKNRYYYMYRNYVIVMRKYFCCFPLFCLKMSLFQVLEFIRIIFENDRFQKYKILLKGIKEGLKNSDEFIRKMDMDLKQQL